MWRWLEMLLHMVGADVDIVVCDIPAPRLVLSTHLDLLPMVQTSLLGFLPPAV
jgi:hypothetical protein